VKILTADAMAAVDRRVIEEIGVPGPVLMENAALGVVEALFERFGGVERVTILCGPGNNGGDGLAVARHLLTRGLTPRVIAVLPVAKLDGDARLQYDVYRALGGEVHEWGEEETVEQLASRVLQWPRGADLVVDALFGTGLTRPLEGRIAELVGTLREARVPILAVDLPSGLDGSRTEIPGPHLSANVTVTFAALKVAHVLSPTAEHCGEVVVTDLGVPPTLIEEAEGHLHLQTAEELAGFLPPRESYSHKGSYGHLLIHAGAPGKTGAAALAARAAVRSGAGLVTVAVPEASLPILEAASLESMTLAVGSGEEATRELFDAAEARDALVVGPGLGRGGDVEEVIRSLVLDTTCPLVLDADGINAFEGEAAQLLERDGPTVLTPHPGELARLLAVESSEIQEDRPRFAAWAARETNAVVVLKGHQSLIAAPDGDVWVNPTGNPGMATGGTGDVLSGALGALLAQRFDALAAAQLGVFLHGLAGDLAAAQKGETSLAAADLLRYLPDAFLRLEAIRDGRLP
jgi:NAD(P)H-hydrate epimerase